MPFRHLIENARWDKVGSDLLSVGDTSVRVPHKIKSIKKRSTVSFVNRSIKLGASTHSQKW